MLKNYLKKYKLRNFIIIATTFLMSGIQVISSIIHTFSMNSLIAGDVRLFFLWNVLSLILWGLLFIINYFEGIYEEKTIQKISTDIRLDITNRITTTSFANVTSKNEGDFVSWLNNDLQQIEDKGIRQYYAFWGYIFSVILSAIALVAYHYSLVLITFILMGLLMKFPSLFEKKITSATNKLSAANETFVSKLHDAISGYSALFGYNMLYKMVDLIRKSSTDLADEKVQFTKTNKIAEGFIGIVNIFSQIAIVTYTGILAGLNLVSIGALSTTGNLASSIFNSISQSSSSLMLMKSVETYFKKYVQFESETEQEDHSLDVNNYIELKNLQYTIADKTILENINVKFEIGKKYAITGASGSGKSTLLNILSGRIDNYQGSILVDGHPLSKDATKELRTITAYTPQTAHIFNDTVLNNITLWNESVMNKAQTGINLLGINDYINQDDIIQENGKNLSGGQKQRIAFARALTAPEKIILLDESTANLDKKTALALENTLLDDQNATVILVTHHLYEENKEKFDEIITLS